MTQRSIISPGAPLTIFPFFCVQFMNTKLPGKWLLVDFFFTTKFLAIAMPRPKEDRSDPSFQLLSEDPTSSESQRKPKIILSDSEDSDSGDTQEYHSAVELPDKGDGHKLKINEEYARRFEHNKKREELHRCMFHPHHVCPTTPLSHHPLDVTNSL